MGNELMNAVKRIERAGGENSYVTNKLRSAVNDVHDVIRDAVMAADLKNVELPRGYKLVQDQGCWELCAKERYYDEWIDRQEIRWAITVRSYNIMKPENGHFYYNSPAPRDAIQEFANDIADGLLDEIADFIEAKTKESTDALAEVEKAKENI